MQVVCTLIMHYMVTLYIVYCTIGHRYTHYMHVTVHTVSQHYLATTTPLTALHGYSIHDTMHCLVSFATFCHCTTWLQSASFCYHSSCTAFIRLQCSLAITRLPSRTLSCVLASFVGTHRRSLLVVGCLYPSYLRSLAASAPSALHVVHHPGHICLILLALHDLQPVLTRLFQISSRIPDFLGSDMHYHLYHDRSKAFP